MKTCLIIAILAICIVSSKTAQTVQYVYNLPQYEKIIQSSDIVVTFFGDQDHPQFHHFESSSKEFNNFVFVFATDSEIKSKHGGGDRNLIRLFRAFDSYYIDFEDELTSETLNDFIYRNQSPDVLQFDEDVAKNIFTASRPTLFLIIKSNSAGRTLSDTFQDIKSNLNVNVIFCIVNIEDILGKKLAEFVGVKEDELPAIRLVKPNPGSHSDKYIFDKELTLDNVITYFDEYNSKKLTKYLRSESIPQNQDDIVQVVVSKTFNDIVLNDENDVLIHFYAPWCGECKEITPYYNEAAEQLKDIKNLIFAKIDATSNEVEGIEDYPKILFYPAKTKSTPIEFNGQRTTQGIIDWVKKHVADSRLATKTDELQDTGYRIQKNIVQEVITDNQQYFQLEIRDYNGENY